MRLGGLGQRSRVADVEASPAQQQERLLIKARLGEDRVELRDDLGPVLVRPQHREVAVAGEALDRYCQDWNPEDPPSRSRNSE